MDIRQALGATSAPVKQGSTDKADVAADKPEGQSPEAAFSKVLQDVAQENTAASTMLEEAALLAATEDVLLPAAGVELPVADLGLKLEDLLGQTQRLDAQPVEAGAQAVDVVVPSVLMQSASVSDALEMDAQHSHVLADALKGRNLGAQPHVAVGQHVATVAAGVQPVGENVLPAAPDAPATAIATATAVLAKAVDAADVVEQTVSEALGREVGGEGRVALQGAWVLDESHADLNPAMQKVMAQVEQWAAASAGVQPKPAERAESSKGSASQMADILGADAGSGTRLTDNAVKETQQAQNALFEHQPEAPVEDMRFWLQGKMQKAEVVMDKDGQSVRVQVSVRGNEAHVSFRSDQAQTRELLDSSLSQLRDMLAQQGVELSGVSVQAEAQGDSAASEQGARSPWNAAPTQYGQVQVPEQAAATPRVQRSQGLDLYA